jgi:hypothetical protein
MTAQWPSLLLLETGLHANRIRTRPRPSQTTQRTQGASWPVTAVFPTAGACADRMARYKMIRQRGTARTVCGDRSKRDARLRHAEGVQRALCPHHRERKTAPNHPVVHGRAGLEQPVRSQEGTASPPKWVKPRARERTGVQVPRTSPRARARTPTVRPDPGPVAPTARPNGLLDWRSQRVWREAPGGIWTAPLDASSLSHRRDPQSRMLS